MIKEHYEQLIQQSMDGFQQLASDEQALSAFTQAHNAASDLELLSTFTTGRPEEVLYKRAIHEFYYALFAVASCRYRHAYGSLRSFIELGLSTVLFSAREIDMIRWTAGKRDVSWRKIINEDKGVFSKPFLSVFSPEYEIDGIRYANIASKLYRECSEYVHGNASSYTTIGMQPVAYDQGKLLEFLDRAGTALSVVEFALLARFLHFAPADKRAAVEGLAIGEFGHEPMIQSIYN